MWLKFFHDLGLCRINFYYSFSHFCTPTKTSLPLKLCVQLPVARFQPSRKIWEDNSYPQTPRYLFLIWDQLWDSFLDKVSPWFCPEGLQLPQRYLSSQSWSSSCAILASDALWKSETKPKSPGVSLGGSGMWCYGCFHNGELIYSKERERTGQNIFCRGEQSHTSWCFPPLEPNPLLLQTLSIAKCNKNLNRSTSLLEDTVDFL